MSAVAARFLLRSAVIATVLLAGSCGDDDDSSTTAATDEPAATDAPSDRPDAEEQEDGTFVTPDGGVFADPPSFALEACDDAFSPVAEDTVSRAEDAGVPVDSVEWLTHHIHAHLDVFLDGEPRVVPAGIGIDNDEHLIAALHTHDCSGTLHLEAEEGVTITLAQVAETWGVGLTGECSEDPCETETAIEVFHNGQPVDQPDEIVVGDCDVIAVVVGEPPATIPDDASASVEGC